MEQWGWNPSWETKLKSLQSQDFIVGRVITEHKHRYKVVTEVGELDAEVSGRIRHEGVVLEQRDLFPAVGDWVFLKPLLNEHRAIIHGFLPRKSKLSRKVAGNKVYEQIVAANMDFVFLLTSLNHDFNPRRLERGLVLALESGTQPIIVLTKADLCDDPHARIDATKKAALGVPVHVISSITHEGLEELTPYLGTGTTIALLGSSGVGKSTLINRLLGEEALRTNTIRSDDKGRHTTTHRQLIPVPSGAVMIDTPGMREIQLWEASDGLDHAYEDILQLSRMCRYKDCLHRGEPGCAVKTAVRNGTLSETRFESYKKMQIEFAELSLKRMKHARAVATERGEQYAQILNYSKKRKGRRTLK